MFQKPFQTSEEVDGGGGRVCVASPCPLHICPDLPDIRVSITHKIFDLVSNVAHFRAGAVSFSQ